MLFTKKYYWALSFVSILVGLTFVYSAYAKLFPVELFEIKLMELGFSSWAITAFLARLIIAAEFFLGALFLLNINLNRKVYLASAGLLLLFSLHLLVQILLFGNEGNCGCFSEALPMTPLEGIIKNIVMTGLIALLYFYYPGITFRRIRLVAVLLLLLFIALPFILNPVILDSSYQSSGSREKLPVEILYNDPDIIPPAYNLRKGKWVLAFLSLTCPHCKIAAYKLQVIKSKNPDIPIYFFLNGKEKLLPEFFKEAGIKDIPYTMLKSKPFIQLGGPSLPVIYLIEDQRIIQKPNYVNLDPGEIGRWAE